METNKLSEVFNNLQRNGINARIENRNETLLIWATSEGYSEVALALIEAGADLNAVNDNGNTALIRAACENRMDLARALIEAGANLDIQNKDGYSALILARRRGNMDVYNLLIKAGADQTLQNNEGIQAAAMKIGAKPKISLTAPRDPVLEQQIIQQIKFSY